MPRRAQSPYLNFTPGRAFCDPTFFEIVADWKEVDFARVFVLTIRDSQRAAKVDLPSQTKPRLFPYRWEYGLGSAICRLTLD